MSGRWVALVGAACVVPTAVMAQEIVVPGVLENAEGNAGNAFPFDIGLFSLDEQRYQQVYAGGEFGSEPLTITGLGFRPDDTIPFGPTTIPSITITLSTTGALPDGLSTTFADNSGPDELVVFDGDLTLSSAATNCFPCDFDILIPLESPFPFDPSSGNLLLDVTNLSDTTTALFDAENTVFDSISRVFTFSVSAGSAAADVDDTIGLVTQFSVSPSQSLL